MSQMEFKYDVFISYSRKNKEWVEKELLKRLNETGITSILDVSHFKIGEDLIEAIEQAILSSRKTIIVLTPAYLESEYCSYELQVVLSLDPAARKKKILLLVLEECVIPAKLKRLIHADFKNKDIWEDSFEQLLESLGYLGIDLEKHLPHTKSDYSYSNSPLQLMEIYLINNSGIRIDYKASGRRSGKDEDILAGMLKGVISIPEDVWKKGGHIKKIETENLNFIIETNENIAIIVVIKGHEISGIRNTIRDCINIIQNRFGSVLADWSGDMKELEEIKEVIDDLDEELKEIIKTTVNKISWFEELTDDELNCFCDVYFPKLKRTFNESMSRIKKIDSIWNYHIENNSSISELRKKVENYIDHLPYRLPQPYIFNPHPYTKTQELTEKTPSILFIPHPHPNPPYFTGRKKERAILTKWLSEDTKYPLLSMVAIGGMGKSALAWRWLMEDVNENGKVKMNIELDGVVWWSFYEKGMTFDCFIRDFAAYRWGDDSPKLKRSIFELYNAVYRDFQQNKYLIVLDGIERILRAYYGLGSPYQKDDDKTLSKDKNYRSCIDSNAERFLEKLTTNITKSKTLLTTRLHPKALDQPFGVFQMKLESLDPEDAVNYLYRWGIKGTEVEIHKECERYGYHPLSLRLLSGLMVSEPGCSGDIKECRMFERINDMAPREHNILELAYKVLDSTKQRLVRYLAAFRSTIEYDAIQAISTDIKKKDLRNALKELVNRGLLFWDKKRNKYDFHPIVRNYCYNQCTSKMKKEIHYRIRDYFSSKSKPKESNINSVKDISNLIEYFYYTIMVKDYTLAHYIFNDGIKIYLDAFGEYHLMIELLESFLSEGEEPVPSLDSDTEKAQVLNDLAFAYKQVGHLINAIKIYQQHNIIREKNNDLSSLSAGLGNLSRVLFDTGDFNAAIYNIKKKNKIAQQIGDKDDIALGHLELGRYLAYIGRFKESDNYLKKGGRWFNKSRNRNGKFITMLYQNIRFFLTNDYIKVLKKIEETNITIQEIINIRYRIRYDILIANIELFKLKKQSYQNENIEKDVKLLHNRLSNILKDCVEHNLTKFKIETLLLFAKLYNISFSIQRDEENDISIKFYESIPKKYYVKIKTNYEKFSTAQRKALNYSVEALHLSILYKYIIKEIDILIFISGLFKIINNHASVKFFINEAQLRSQQKIDIETGVYTMKKKDTSYQYNIVYAETKILFENMEGNHDLYHARFNFMFSENI